ncbi:flagellar basal body rod protein FlgC, partial [Escherichia coli]
GVMELSASALTAQRQRAEVATSNLANTETTRTEEGGPYKRKLVVFGQQPNRFHLALANFSAAPVRGVVVRDVVEDAAPPIMRYEPG